MKGIWGGIINVGQNGHFELQADAITQDMAEKMMKGQKVELPEFNYNPNEWNWLDLGQHK